MLTGSFTGDVQYCKTVFFGDYNFLKFVNVICKGEKLCFPLLHTENFFFRTIAPNDRSANAAITVSPFRYVMLKNGVDLAIYCNDKFLELYGEDEQKGVILHEIAHYALGHLGANKDGEDVHTYQNREIEADAFACKHGFGEPLANALRICMEDSGGYDDFLAYRIACIKQKAVIPLT